MGDGPQTVLSSGSDTASPFSPLAVLPNGHNEFPGALAPPAVPPRATRSSSSGGSLPSPAMVTSEARQVLEAFLLRTQSMDRGSAGSMARLVPQHLQVIEEIRHTRGHRSEDSQGSIDGLVVEAYLPKGKRGGEIASMDVEHRACADGRHVTDISVHVRGLNDGPEQVLRTHVTHPADDDPFASAAKVVTEESSEVFIDASLSRQCSLQDESRLGATSAPPSAPLSRGTTPGSLSSDARGRTPASMSSRAYDADFGPTPSPGLQEVAHEAAAAGKAWKKRRKTISRFGRWLRGRAGDSRKDEATDSVQIGGGDRPPYQTMTSYSSSSSSTISSHGAPSRSLVHRDLELEERRKRRRRERKSSFRWRHQNHSVEASSGSVFHQLYATLRYGRKRHTASDPTLLDEHKEGEPGGRLSPSLEEEREMYTSVPDLQRAQETQDVLATFRCAIDKGGCKVHTNGECHKALPADATDSGKQVDQTNLTINLNSSSNSQSSTSQGNDTASSPDCLGPDGVAKKKEVDRVARLLDEIAHDINGKLDSSRTRERRKSTPNLRESATMTRDRATSETRREQIAKASDVSLSRSSPMLNEEAQQAMRAKARRMKSQSQEDLVSLDLILLLAECDTYERFEALMPSCGVLQQNSSWKQITLFYWLTRRIVRVVRRHSHGEDREAKTKDFAMTFFNKHFANFVVKRGGWRNLIESTEDSELD